MGGVKYDVYYMCYNLLYCRNITFKVAKERQGFAGMKVTIKMDIG